MKKVVSLLLLVAAAVLSCGATAAVVAERAFAVVERVQMPAWLERHGKKLPLEPGQSLQNRDRVTTGADARVLIRLAEGSAVKLGETAQLDLNALGVREGRVLTAAFDVPRGAFRFTAGAEAGRAQGRAINVRIDTLTASIREMHGERTERTYPVDLWGRADGERDLVALIEGRVAVFHPAAGSGDMGAPMSAYAVPKGAAPLPVAAVDSAQWADWAKQTEISAGSAYAERGGRWKLELGVFDCEREALALYDRVRAAGYAVKIQPQGVGKRYRYALRIESLPSRSEAEVLAAQIAGTLDLDSLRVTR